MYEQKQSKTEIAVKVSERSGWDLWTLAPWKRYVFYKEHTF